MFGENVATSAMAGVDWNDIVQPLITISPTFACVLVAKSPKSKHPPMGK